MTLLTLTNEFEIPSREAAIDAEWALEIEYSEEYGDWDLWFRPYEDAELYLAHSYETKDDALEDMNRFVKAYLNGDKSFRFGVL